MKHLQSWKELKGRWRPARHGRWILQQSRGLFACLPPPPRCRAQGGAHVHLAAPRRVPRRIPRPLQVICVQYKQMRVVGAFEHFAGKCSVDKATNSSPNGI